MDVNEIVLLERARSDCYRFLSALFCRPQKDLFLEENLLGNLAEALKKACPTAVTYASAMEESIGNYSNEKLMVEYAGLFIGPFGVKAPPYGSVYLDGERRVMGDSTMAVIQMYLEEGLSGSDDFSDLPDHIAVELEFMSFLIYKEIEAVENSNFRAAIRMEKRQESFLKNFLRKWVPPFCRKIREGTDNGFYNALAECTSVYVENSSPMELQNRAGETSFEPVESRIS